MIYLHTHIFIYLFVPEWDKGLARYLNINLWSGPRFEPALSKMWSLILLLGALCANIRYKYICMYWYPAQYSMSELWCGGVPTSDSGYTRLRLGVPTHSLIPATRYACQWQETMSTEHELYTIWIQHMDTNEGQTHRAPSSRIRDYFASLATGGVCSTQI